MAEAAIKLVTGGLAFALIVTLAGRGLAQERDFISIVGSSTVYPFATVVAEQFGRSSGFRTPKVEQSGTGGGIKLFCAGLDVDTPDIANASRPMTKSEYEECARNGVTEIVQLQFGFDGIVLADALAGPAYDLTLHDLFLALAKQVPDPSGAQALVANPYRSWSDVDPQLPDIPIEVYGPSPVHGTYDAFRELAMQGGAAANMPGSRRCNPTIPSASRRYAAACARMDRTSR
jgi:phosphate transport system substrate-binding protein